jgi:hypothetical protein
MPVAERRARFRELHAADGIFVMRSPWDAGSARLLASCGFEALATASAGLRSRRFEFSRRGVTPPSVLTPRSSVCHTPPAFIVQ